MLSKPGQVCTLYSSITSRYILVVVFLLLLLTANMMHTGMCVQTLVLCGDQTQTALLVGEEHKHTSTQVHKHTLVTLVREGQPGKAILPSHLLCSLCLAFTVETSGIHCHVISHWNSVQHAVRARYSHVMSY